ncbi:MAG: multiubiquitin domain-containing protein [Rhizobiaceae bacterium]|nr:multiubiquitin domain-containing protein [Rhizobiaceae bacterium]
MEKLLDKNEKEDAEEVFDGISDIAECTKAGKKPPRSKGYRILINGKPFVSKKARITGREVLILGGKTPPENFTLRVKLAGHKPERVGLDEVVDLRHPGVEKFKSLPKDQTEG